MGLEQRGRGGKEHKRKFEIENATEFRRVFFFCRKTLLSDVFAVEFENESVVFVHESAENSVAVKILEAAVFQGKI